MNVDRVDIKKNTDQLNFEDFLGGITRIVTITGVERGRKEAQYDISIEGDDRYWRPPATVLKLLVLAYTDDPANWIGKRVSLYGDPEVKAPGGKKSGGIRVSHLSHIEKPITASLSVTRGQTGIFTVDPLPDAPTPPTDSAIACAIDTEQLKAWWREFPTQRAAIEARVEEIKVAEQPTDAQ